MGAHFIFPCATGNLDSEDLVLVRSADAQLNDEDPID
jgi:hypothetical protein